MFSALKIKKRDVYASCNHLKHPQYFFCSHDEPEAEESGFTLGTTSPLFSTAVLCKADPNNKKLLEKRQIC